MNNLTERVGGRKFLISMLVVVVSSILVYKYRINDGVYSNIIIALLGIYVGGNVIQKIKNKD